MFCHFLIWFPGLDVILYEYVSIPDLCLPLYIQHSLYSVEITTGYDVHIQHKPIDQLPIFCNNKTASF